MRSFKAFDSAKNLECFPGSTKSKVDCTTVRTCTVVGSINATSNSCYLRSCTYLRGKTKTFSPCHLNSVSRQVDVARVDVSVVGPLGRDVLRVAEDDGTRATGGFRVRHLVASKDLIVRRNPTNIGVTRGTPAVTTLVVITN